MAQNVACEPIFPHGVPTPGAVEAQPAYRPPPRNAATFGWVEMCATRDPECALGPVPQVWEKQWYNDYVYVPEESSHLERHFLERFVPGPDGEWIDSWKARSMADFLEEEYRRQEEHRIEQRLIKNGTVISQTIYTDAYTGEPLIRFHDELLTQHALFAEHDIHPSELDVLREQTWCDFANLRFMGPLAPTDRNKRIAPHAYEWFDRNHNLYIKADKDYHFHELPSVYTDHEMYGKLRTMAGDIIGATRDGVNFMEKTAERLGEKVRTEAIHVSKKLEERSGHASMT